MDTDNSPSSQAPEQERQISMAELQLMLEQMQSQQNLPLGALAGLVAALVGASIWALITVLSEYQIGWMAIGIGFMVGFAMRLVGKGITQTFGIIGAALSLVGCLVGNLLTMTYFVAANEEIDYVELLTALDASLAIEIMTVTFDPMDLLFYGLALYFGYKYAFTDVSEAQAAVASGSLG